MSERDGGRGVPGGRMPIAGQHTVPTSDDMEAFGVELGRLLSAGDLVVLTGPLGAGKTTLTRGIGEAMHVRGPVTSPTFVLARTHPSLTDGPPLVHVDAYRLGSALELDDLSPVYRAHLFAMMSRPYTAANVGANELERSRRQNFGAVFEAAYIHRDIVCLSCHNSEFSVTYNEDPAKNRAWPVPGSSAVVSSHAGSGHPASVSRATMRSRSASRPSTRFGLTITAERWGPTSGRCGAVFWVSVVSSVGTDRVCPGGREDARYGGSPIRADTGTPGPLRRSVTTTAEDPGSVGRDVRP